VLTAERFIVSKEEFDKMIQAALEKKQLEEVSKEFLTDFVQWTTMFMLNKMADQSGDREEFIDSVIDAWIKARRRIVNTQIKELGKLQTAAEGNPVLKSLLKATDKNSCEDARISNEMILQSIKKRVKELLMGDDEDGKRT
jgi:hypothetical protein